MSPTIFRLSHSSVSLSTDPVFPGNPLKYKNHLYEYCQAKKWPEDKFPVFSEDQEAQGNKSIIRPININCMIVLLKQIEHVFF